MVKSRGIWLVFLVCAIGGVAAILSAQTVRSSPPGGAPNDELLAEIRGLRADLNYALTGTIRAQLFVARLQLQEQRVNAVEARLADNRRLLTAKQQELVAVDGELRNLKDVLRTKSLELEEEERKQSEESAAQLEAQLQRGQAEELQMRIREAELSSQLASEQGRWIDFNERLTEIERSLPQVAPGRQ